MSLKTVENFYLLLHPRPVVVITTRCPGDRVNLVTVAWITPVAEDEPTIAFALDRSSYTYQCLEHCPELVVNIPDANQLDTVYRIGTVSGRSVDKVKEFGVKLAPSRKVSVPRWEDAIGWIEAKVSRYLDVGECRLYIAQVLEAYAREDLFTDWGWDLSKASVLLHAAGRAFCTPGRKLFAKK